VRWPCIVACSLTKMEPVSASAVVKLILAQRIFQWVLLCLCARLLSARTLPSRWRQMHLCVSTIYTVTAHAQPHPQTPAVASEHTIALSFSSNCSLRPFFFLKEQFETLEKGLLDLF
jgi:hypothetical protein